MAEQERLAAAKRKEEEFVAQEKERLLAQVEHLSKYLPRLARQAD